MNDEKIIRKKYGEKMWHLCRSLFPTILNEPGRLSSILINQFQPSRFLYEDLKKNLLIERFKNCVYYLYGKESEDYPDTDKTPEELLRSVGYTLYKCDTEQSMYQFLKYYKVNERLCSFDENRPKKCYVFFAVRDDADSLKRSDFIHPERQDRYGTSVISIQFSRDFYYTLSIKNRYNHAVLNPDSTFDNNLENIVPGLTNSFAKFYGLKEVYSSDRLDIPGYVRDSNGRLYKKIYSDIKYIFCLDNILIASNTKELVMKYSDKNRYLFMDTYVLDLKEKKIVYSSKSPDSFVSSLGEIIDVKITNEDGYKKVVITNSKNEEIIVKLDEQNRIIGYINNYAKIITSRFLENNRVLREIRLDNCITIDDYFLLNNHELEEIDFPKVVNIGKDFMGINYKIKRCFLPKVKFINDNFMRCNNALVEYDFDSVKSVGDRFLENNNSLEELYMKSVFNIGSYFMIQNSTLKKIYIPKIRKIGSYFLGRNKILSSLVMPRFYKVGNGFLDENRTKYTITRR